jgi:hypothetical protein
MLTFRSIQARGLDSETSRRDLLQEHGILEQALGRCPNQGSAVDERYKSIETLSAAGESCGSRESRKKVIASLESCLDCYACKCSSNASAPPLRIFAIMHRTLLCKTTQLGMDRQSQTGIRLRVSMTLIPHRSCIQSLIQDGRDMPMRTDQSDHPQRSESSCLS